MDDNNNPTNNRNDGSTHMGGMKMDPSNNMNMKKPATTTTTMPKHE
jgi:hypothetical protein